MPASLDINCSYRLPLLQLRWESSGQYSSDELFFGSHPAQAHNQVSHLRTGEFPTRVAYNATGGTIKRRSAFQIYFAQ